MNLSQPNHRGSETLRFAPPQWIKSSAWIFLPIACHLCFAWIGFSPTDDGWLLAVARRIAGGEVPHRDFIFVRPALSAILQIPLVWWSGDHVIWLSRLWGWLMLGAVAWIWSGRTVSHQTGWLARMGLYCCAMLLCSHTFPVMAWHSIDGMLFATLAVLLASHERSPGFFRAAFLVAGLALLCRQNFAVFGPLLLLATGGCVAERFMAGFCFVLPLLLYAGWMVVVGGALDFWQQVSSVGGDFVSVAFAHFLSDPFFLGGIAFGTIVAGALVMGYFSKGALGRFLPTIGFTATGFGAALALWLGPNFYTEFSFILFGFVLGLACGALWRGVSQSDRLTLVAGLALSWVTAISIGYNSTELMSGVLLLLLWRLLTILPRETKSSRPQIFSGCVAAVLVAIGLALTKARQSFPYQDRPAADLHWEVGKVLAGGAGIYTNQTTYEALADLQGLTGSLTAKHHPYVILTDFSAFWIRSAQANPLACEWPQQTELGKSPLLIEKMLSSLRLLSPESRIIVQKFLTSDLSRRQVLVPNTQKIYVLQNWVKTHSDRVQDTRYFEIYLPPRN